MVHTLAMTHILAYGLHISMTHTLEHCLHISHDSHISTLATSIIHNTPP
jgi:hypothetical protein